jgi:hypothetical protein
MLQSKVRTDVPVAIDSNWHEVEIVWTSDNCELWIDGVREASVGNAESIPHEPAPAALLVRASPVNVVESTYVQIGILQDVQDGGHATLPLGGQWIYRETHERGSRIR